MARAETTAVVAEAAKSMRFREEAGGFIGFVPSDCKYVFVNHVGKDWLECLSEGHNFVDLARRVAHQYGIGPEKSTAQIMAFFEDVADVLCGGNGTESRVDPTGDCGIARSLESIALERLERCETFGMPF